MNKIFRVVWSHAAQSWVTVSELTSAKGKTKSKTMSKLAALSLVAGAISMVYGCNSRRDSKYSCGCYFNK